ncbi:MAG: hypothetical protein ACTHNT_03100, partial [Actinomycetales bacterium]
MRRRLLQTTLTVAVVAVLLLGVPLAIAGALLQRETAQANVATTAATLGGGPGPPPGAGGGGGPP